MENVVKKILQLAWVVCASGVGAQVPVDLSQSKVSIQNAETLRVENLNVPGLGSYQVNFRWNPQTVSFVPAMDSLVSNGSYCESASLSGNVAYSSGNADAYLLRQRTTSTMTVGAITSKSGGAYGFTVTWAKTSTAAENPYLTGKTVTNFDRTKGYGLVGISSSAYPFSHGTLVEVSGGIAPGTFNIKQVGGTASAVFTTVASSVAARANCPSSSNGLYSGNVSYSTGNTGAYQISFLNVGSGSINTISGGAYGFAAIWEPSTTGKAGFSYGLVSMTSSAYFLMSGATIFVADVGDGVLVTSLTDSQQAAATTAFLK